MSCQKATKYHALKIEIKQERWIDGSKHGTKICISADKDVKLEKVLQLPQILPLGGSR